MLLRRKQERTKDDKKYRKITYSLCSRISCVYEIFDKPTPKLESNRKVLHSKEIKKKPLENETLRCPAPSSFWEKLSEARPLPIRNTAEEEDDADIENGRPCRRGSIYTFAFFACIEGDSHAQG
ncbi:hypothetical protein Trydic_g17354 [Trypoxylus dichotomus]